MGNDRGRGRGCAPTCPSATTRLHLSLHIYNHTHLPMPAHFPSVTARPHAIEDMGVPAAATPYANASTPRPCSYPHANARPCRHPLAPPAPLRVTAQP